MMSNFPGKPPSFGSRMFGHRFQEPRTPEEPQEIADQMDGGDFIEQVKLQLANFDATRAKEFLIAFYTDHPEGMSSSEYNTYMSTISAMLPQELHNELSDLLPLD